LELVQLYSAADITLSLSYAETFGLTIAESMSCGTPVVAYGNSAQSEVVKPGTGFTVPTDSISSLKDAIDRVISLGKSYFSDNCRLAANTYYNMDDNYGRYISLYNNMLRGGVILVAVASAWTEDKGLFDFIKLSKSLPDKCQLVLVGLTKEQIEKLPDNILGIERTDNVLDLVFLYNIASIVLSLSYSETFGLSIVEGMACGTPAIVYNNTAQKDIVTADTGLVVETGNIQAVNNAINIILTHGKSYYAASCRNRVCAFFDMDRQYQKYVSLYNNLLAIK
jgi:glycosyltransferase involved in cell wall biosynthesis